MQIAFFGFYQNGTGYALFEDCYFDSDKIDEKYVKNPRNEKFDVDYSIKDPVECISIPKYYIEVYKVTNCQIYCYNHICLYFLLFSLNRVISI